MPRKTRLQPTALGRRLEKGWGRWRVRGCWRGGGCVESKISSGIVVAEILYL